MSEGLERWRGKAAVVTGASSGIGAAVVEALCEAGLKVAFCARREERIASLKERVEERGGVALARAVDLRREEEILSFLDEAKRAFGGIDVLVNNAGLGHKAPLTSGVTEHWREMLEVNVLALCIATREVVQDMTARGAEGHVLHVSSMAAHRVPQESGVYSATKFAVRSLTEGLRLELRAMGSPIRVTSLSPGFVETEFAAQYHKSEQAAAETYGRYKVLEPEDVARAVLYALSQPPWVELHDVLMRPTVQAN